MEKHARGNAQLLLEDPRSSPLALGLHIAHRTTKAVGEPSTPRGGSATTECYWNMIFE